MNQSLSPQYDLIREIGPPHNKSFTIKCTIGSTEREATASTKKLAKQMATELALQDFHKKNVPEPNANLTRDPCMNVENSIMNVSKLMVNYFKDIINRCLFFSRFFNIFFCSGIMLGETITVTTI